ncbi:MAG: pilus assembly protein N-terminal domain-containing protein [Alphaproteobacteria bacterium]|nr:pilus assembly protein N-terminal domain-containing protein [Alphaproteobacteria bacterium]
MMAAHKRSWYLALAVLALFSLSLMVAGISAFAQDKADVKPVMRADLAEGPVIVTMGKAEVVPIEGEFSDVLVANPNIIEVSALNTQKIYVVGKTIGDTNIIVLDDEGEVLRKIDVHVTYDLVAIQAMVNKFFPDEDVTVKSVHDQVALTGTVSSPEKAERVTNLVGHYVSDLQDVFEKPIDTLIVNMLEVRGEMQVMLRVKIVEASRSILKEVGIESGFNDPDETAAQRLFARNPPSNLNGGSGNLTGQLFTLPQVGLTQDPLGTGQIFADTGVSGIGFLNVLVNALEQEA